MRVNPPRSDVTVFGVDESEPSAAERRLAANLRAARERAGLSQKEVAEKMHDYGYQWRQQTVTRVESCERAVSHLEAEAMATVLGVHVGTLSRPAGLQEEAWRLLDAAARVRESRDAARRYEASSEGLRRLMKRVADEGNAEALADEFAIARIALREKP